MDTTTTQAVWPTLRSHDAPALIDFLTRVLGFRTVAVFGDGDRVDHAQLAWPAGGGVMLGSVRGGDDPWPQPPGSAGVHLVVAEAADVDAVHARVVAAGASVLRPPADPGYGGRGLVCRDPDGNLWSVGTYAGEPQG